MPNIKKEVIKTYKLELSEAEYHAFLSLVGAHTYNDYKDHVNQEYSASLHSGKDEKMKVLSYNDYIDLFNKLYDNK